MLRDRESMTEKAVAGVRLTRPWSAATSGPKSSSPLTAEEIVEMLIRGRER